MILITAAGPDRPGMAHAVAALLSEAGCNIEDTTMTRLSGEFAMILVVSPPDELSAEQLARLLAPLEASHGLFLSCRDIGPEEEEVERFGARHIVSVYGPEARGLVARITQVLAEHGVNISDVQTRVASGGALYVMILEIEVPQFDESDVALEAELKLALEHAAREIGVSVSMRALDEETL
jgi:glycine cleavage system transcriptional repressor